MKRILLAALLSSFLFTGCTDAPVLDSLPPVEVVPLLVTESPVSPPAFLFEDYLRGACRVVGGGSGGSGVCYKIDDEFVYILTCRHVVGETKDFKVEFWLDGKITGEYDARALEVLSNVDVAVLIIPVSSFKADELPLAFPIASISPGPGEAIVSVGCAGLAWQTLFEGHVMGADTKGNFMFVPPPKGGRSGSAIFQDGKIVGILWGSDRKTKGYAVKCEDMQSLVETGNIFFTAPWCEYCKEMGPIIQSLRDSGIAIQTIDYNLNTAFAEMYSINSLPAYVNSRGETISGVQVVEKLREFFSHQNNEREDNEENTP